MNNKLKKIVALCLAFAMVATVVLPESAYAKTKKTANYVTRAYVLQQVEKLIGATQTSDDVIQIKDVKKSSPYYKTMSIAVNAGLVKLDSNQKLHPTKKATNKYVASVLAKISETSTKNVLEKKTAATKLTKKSLKTFLNQKFPNVVSKSDAKLKKGNVIINKPVTLNDAKITGDLVIGDGVADKEVVLNNVTVTGKTIVRGGGENSIIITGTSDISDMVIRQVNNKVSIKVKGDAKVRMVYINDGSNDVNIVGTVGIVNIVGENLKVTLTDAVVNTLIVADTAKNAVVEADKNSSIKEATLNAAGTKIQGEGKVEAINVNANDTVVTVKDAKINVKDNVTPPKTNADNNSQTTTDTNISNDNNSGGGSSSGGSSTSGGSTSGGSSENPSTPDVPKVNYVTDSRFADGYPKVVTDKENQKITITYKLKDGVASEEKPAKIYNLVTDYNTNWDATTEAVLHGHLGVVNEQTHETVSTEYYDFLKITDAKEYAVEYKLMDHVISDGLTTYSVIDCDGKVSDTPTKIAFDRDTATSVVKNKVYVSDVYINKAKDTVYLYLRSELDQTTVTSAAAFTIKKNGQTLNDIRISKMELMSKTGEKSGPYVACIKLSLNKALDDSTVNYSLYYAGTEITDTVGNPLETFDRSLMTVSDGIKNAYTSQDGQYVSFEVPVYQWMSYTTYQEIQDDLGVYVDGKQINQKNWSYSWSIGDMNIRVHDTSLTNSKKVELKSVSGKTLYTAAGDKLNNLSANLEKDSEGSISSAVYEKENNKIVLTLTENSSFERGFGFYDCNFMVKIAGKEYRLRGNSYVRPSNAGYIIEIDKDNLKHLDLSEVSEFSIKYAPIISADERTNDWNDLFAYNSGKPVDATDYIPVTIQ